MSVQTVESMANWVEENIAEHPTLGDMSAYVGYSPWYCSALGAVVHIAPLAVEALSAEGTPV